MRLRILSLLTGAAMSSAELARELDMNHAAVSFHVRKLADAGYLELAEMRSVRGGKERRYRQRPAGGPQWQQEDPRLTVRAVSEEVVRRATETTAEAWRLFGDAELWVDAAVWEDVAARIVSAIRDLHAAAQPTQTPETLHVSATAMLFTLDGTQ
ncbi:MAG TPA: winged helix-turn-helix domain-containing protein [Solirubrobacteraceae bacterium]|nr:winged helix-turn-helix domain-containing protein [Solirubrobacteraceae bacterium]